VEVDVVRTKQGGAAQASRKLDFNCGGQTGMLISRQQRAFHMGIQSSFANSLREVNRKPN
jgi:hypothetical protein